MDLPATSTFTRVSRFFRRPRQSAGNVYYAKLETLQGTFYKIGFTTKPTLHERMAYNGQGSEKLIKQVLLFSYHANAWDIEQTLLDHFSKHRAFKKGNDPSKPLYKNGQSELFATDVLGLDEPLYLSRVFTTQTSIVDAEQARYGCFAALIGLALAPFTLGISRRRQKLTATPDLSGMVLPLCLIPNSALKNAPPFKSAVRKGSACARLLA